jgi:hypothetical protein
MRNYARNTGGACLADWLAVGLAGQELIAKSSQGQIEPNRALPGKEFNGKMQ